MSKQSIRQQLLQLSQNSDHQELQQPHYIHIFFFEIIGVALLTLGINNSVYAKMQDIFIAASLFVAIIFSDPFTGGHVNPSVTMGFISKKIGLTFSSAIVYWIAQFCGGILGSLLAYATVGAINAPSMKAQDPQFLISDMIGQSIGTFIFVFFVLLVKHEKLSFCQNKLSIWMCIGGALYIGRHYAIRSGGCLNPAVALGMALISRIMQGEDQSFKRAWIFIIGPLLGGYFAGIFFEKYIKSYQKVLSDLNKYKKSNYIE